MFRTSIVQRWRPVVHSSECFIKDGNNQFEYRVASELANREITENDYDMLLQLDGFVVKILLFVFNILMLQNCPKIDILINIL